MQKNVLIFGLVLGTILCVNMIYMVNLCYNDPDFNSNNIIGFAAVIIILSLIFFGVRNYRNNQLHGIISFGKAFKTGALIALMGSTMYVIAWLFYYYLFVPDFLDVYIAHVLKDTAQNNISELAAKTKEMENFRMMYKNPFFIIVMTYVEVLPIGLVISLISALVLKKKNTVNISSNSQTR